MNLNLINDAWLPIWCKDGSRVVIAPWQIADPELSFPGWPRADLNIACLELLAGLVFLADPPRDVEDWRARQAPDPQRLRAKLATFAPAFNLLGDGPRFMQDLEAFERGLNEANSPDLLFIDSAGGQTTRNNADLTVKRDRYAAVDLPLAAMALYALQAHAPAGGAGNRTSMRGGGPLVTLVDPGGGLWQLIWANVLHGTPAAPEALPWMQRTRTSEQGQQVFPHEAHPSEAYFGAPRRLRLIPDGERIVAVAQRPYGANYSGWEHPLTPHYRMKPGGELLPRHPRAGAFGFRNWLGVVAKRSADGRDLARRAKALDLWAARGGREADVLVAGWAMENMRPLDFQFSRAPLVDLEDEAIERMEALVDAAEMFASALSGAIGVMLGKGEARDAMREEFFLRAQDAFEVKLRALLAPSVDWSLVAQQWVHDLRAVAVSAFDAFALPGFADRDIRAQQKIKDARRALAGTFAGYGKLGRDAFSRLDLPIPEQGRKQKGKAA